jgi:tetratricopeptide (TPR) repeat protein
MRKVGLALLLLPALAAFLALPMLPAGPGVTLAPSAQEQLGAVQFKVSCDPATQADFSRAVALLHSFALDAANTQFTAVGQRDPSCGMAYWGVAMTWLGNPLAGPTTPKGLQEGSAAVAKAKAAGAKTQRERDYIAAIDAFYADHAKVDHRTRATNYEKAMERLATAYPDDREATIFYALALNVTLNPSDKTYANQLKAAGLLEKAFAEQPNHPGVAHYLIHSYDFPPIAQKGLPAARRYASIAPSAPHALHMPSHIFTRVGDWQQSIDTNKASAKAAVTGVGAAEHTHGLRSYEALHAYDYMMYGFMQLGKDREAQGVMDDVLSTKKLNVDHFAGAFALAAIPARYTLERARWGDAAKLAFTPSDLAWDKFPQAESITWFARGLGAARSGDLASARRDVARLEALRDSMTAAKSTYWAQQSEIQRRAVAAWIAFGEGRRDEALALARSAADLEDSTEKHPVTPGSIKPARELLAEMLLEAKDSAAALREFEASQKIDPNRLNGLWGAGRAAEQAGDAAKAKLYYGQLVTLAQTADTPLPAVTHAKKYLGQ